MSAYDELAPTSVPRPAVTCECDYDGHRCRNQADEHAGVQTSPRLCTPCLYGCAP